MQANQGGSEYLSRKEVAALLHVSTATVSRWARDSRIPHIRTLGGHRRYPSRIVLHLAESLQQMAVNVDGPHEQEG